MPILDARVWLEHEPLRPVASLFELLREDDPENLFDRLVVFERQEEFNRSLADVARAPRRTRVLFEAVWHRQVHHRVVSKPRKYRIESGNIGVAAGDTQAARNALPIARRGCQHFRAVGTSCVLSCQTLRRPRVPQRPHDRKTKLARRSGLQGHIGATARASIGVQQFIAANLLDRIGCADNEMIHGLRIALTPQCIWVGTKRDLLARRVNLDLASVVEFALAQDKMAEYEKPTGLFPRP